jgi:hypothetical protein
MYLNFNGKVGASYHMNKLPDTVGAYKSPKEVRLEAIVKE